MSHGGKRNGAGRKVGSANRRTREVADRAAEEGITPLEVMLEAMCAARDEGDMEKAVEYAHMAAPYIHPRLTATQVDANVKTSGPPIIGFLLPPKDNGPPERNGHPLPASGTATDVPGLEG